ncbi:E3 ubiquitin-protein ligase TRIM32 [Bienertia sinuspersici]
MWSFPNPIPTLRLRKVSTAPNLCCTDLSDEDTGSSSSREEGLECPICWESFNIVENVPYVLWCGHTLCQNCVLGLQWAIVKLPAQKFKLPFFVSCPWCSILSFRWVYRGTLKFPRKNYFILWMVESLNEQRAKSYSSVCDDSQPAFPSRISSLVGCSANNYSPRRDQPTQARQWLGRNIGDTRVADDINVERPQFSLHKSLDYFIHVVSKLPLVILFLVTLFFVIPGCVAILVLYLLVSVLLALPSILVLYFAYPTLDWLLREIAS